MEKELANIRRKFSKTHRTLTAYERKKYVLKLLYIYMLGYNVDFGHTEALKLISATTYGEKQVGYMTTSVILNERNEFLRMAINSIRTDVISNSERNQCLGLACIANVGGREFADTLAGDVETILMTPTVRPVVRKKAALCLLRLFRKNNEIILAEQFSSRLVDLLDAERDLGVLIGVLGLLLGIVQHDYRGYEACVPRVISIMERLTSNKDIPPEYLYYGIPSPWLQVKCMKILQYFPTPDDPVLLDAQLTALKNILKTESVKNLNKNNALHAILFEAINLVTSMDFAHELLDPCVELLGKLLTMGPNIRYLALNTLNTLAAMPDLREPIKVYQDQVIASLHDADISIRKRALTLLFSMCDASNVHSIVEELVKYFVTADFDIREELALKTAILAERYSRNDRMWFIEIALQMIEKAGDFINDDLWHRLVQVATNDTSLHADTAKLMFVKLRDDGAINELVLRVVSYCLGEFGYLLPIPASQYVDLLVPAYKDTDDRTRAIMLTAFIKVAMHKNCDQAAMGKIVQVFQGASTSMDVEIQQRACEYLALLRLGPSMRPVLEPMPEYPDTSSVLERHVQVENVVSDVAAGVRKLGMSTESALLEQPTAPARSSSKRDLTLSAPSAPSAPKDAVADLLGGLLGGGSGTAPSPAPAALPTPSGSGLDLDELFGAAPRAAQQPRALAAPPPVPALAAPAPMPVATRPSANALDELLGIVPAAPAPAPAQPPRALDAVDDIFGLASSASQPPPQVAAPVKNGVEPTVNIQECAKRLLVSDNGVLYEDANVQIGIKSQWQGSQGRVMFYVGNKMATADLQNVVMNIPQMSGLRHALQPVPASIGPKRQVQLMLQVAVTGAFVGALKMDFAYSSQNGGVSLSLDLPVRLIKFLGPMTIASPQEFIARWHQMVSAGQQQKIMDIAPQYATGIEAVANAFAGMRLAVHRGLDPNPANLVAGSRFVGETSGEVFIGVRVESDANVRGRYRFTCASLDVTASRAVLDTIVAALGP